jgi:transposase-like protein
MTRRPRRNHSATFKAKVAIEAVKDERTIAEIAQKPDVRPNQVTEWRAQLLERATVVHRFAGSRMVRDLLGREGIKVRRRHAVMFGACHNLRLVTARLRVLFLAP